jgi:hypothetical protein
VVVKAKKDNVSLEIFYKVWRRRTFSRGREVSIAGKLNKTPFGVLAIGHVDSN